MVPRPRDSQLPFLPLIIVLASLWPALASAQLLPHQRISESIANRFTITIPLKQCQYPRLWAERGTSSLQTSSIRGTTTISDGSLVMASKLSHPPFRISPHTTRLFTTISDHYRKLGYAAPTSLVMIDSPSANAFVRHAKEVVITKALLIRVTDESELAFVLAHELAHIALHHDSKGGISAEVAADALALQVVTALNFNPCSGSNVLERLGSPAKVTLVSVTPRLNALHDKTEDTCG